jgi:predicted nucleic acid-binding protein
VIATYFFDSSALVKRYVNEPGSTWVDSIIDPNSGAHVYVAAITGVEVVAALARKQKGGLVSPGDASAAILRFQQDFANEYRIVDINDAVITRSMAIARMRALRGYDAVQLGAALEITARRVALGASLLTLVTSDNELLGAARAEGLPTADPNEH